MVTRKFAAFCAAALLALGSTRSAEALNILPADVGAQWSYSQTSNVAGVTADYTWEVVSFLFNGGTNQTTVVFDVTVENTSTINSDLRAFSVSTPAPDAIGGSIVGAIFDNLSVDLNGPGGDFEVCASSAATNNCNGISQDGLEDGTPADTTTLSLIFAGNVSTSGVNLENFCSRWQEVGPNSQDSAKGCDTGENFTPTPEPGSLALLGAGIAAVAARRARKKREQI